MEFATGIIIFFTAALAAAINSVAGGGTFLLFPILIMQGMGAVVANIACTIALWPGTVASALAYRKELGDYTRYLPRLVIISILGSGLGAAVLLLTPEQQFQTLVPWLLLFATLIFTFGKQSASAGLRLLKKERKTTAEPNFVSPGVLLLHFCTSVYGGYFGAGIGILMLATLQLMGLSHIHRMNALKTSLGSAINAVAVAVFIFSGLVPWEACIVMLLGAILGGFVGARLALRVSPRAVRLCVSVIGFAMTAYFFLK